LTIGVNKPHKNHRRLVEAFCSTIIPRDVHLVVAGPHDPRYPGAAVYAQRLGIADRVVELGPVDEDDLSALYTAADAMAFPSLDEGFGLPPLEAMACGTPVACSWAGSLPEVVGDAARLFDPLDPVAIARAIAVVVGDDGERRRLRVAGLARGAESSWSHAAGATWRVYREAIDA
jgi:alpha-1,3-rhamnosyl/mannosyltransferase